MPSAMLVLLETTGPKGSTLKGAQGPQGLSLTHIKAVNMTPIVSSQADNATQGLKASLGRHGWHGDKASTAGHSGFYARTLLSIIIYGFPPSLVQKLLI
ncbi:hypothetical protein AJ78_06863 [Emergomyces pasteurianus Ep9510]|uniref:Uncharacterized protein n=1 Tax=Emergomyces pasteurianus Ep9510 TaxID=1447872 RepID=A0A1J9P7F6_9EURO|nr:hypothetical protein AJ78_06863 [Emergomyces pasteurianus Ep9510]